jgi:hypothetical protein
MNILGKIASHPHQTMFFQTIIPNLLPDLHLYAVTNRMARDPNPPVLVMSPPVRHLKFLPLTYLIGLEGFVFFLPFLMLCLAIHLLIRSKHI